MGMLSVRFFKEVRYSIIPVLIVVVLAVVLATLMILHSKEPDLSKPVSSDDWITVYHANDEILVKAGKPIDGYPAPLSNYLKIFALGEHGGETAASWIDNKAAASYFLPLYDKHELKAVYLPVRVADHKFEANEMSYEYECYQAAKDNLEKKCAADGNAISSHYVMWMHGCYIFIANTQKGVIGQLFSVVPQGGGVLTDVPGYVPLPKDERYDMKEGAILDEQELVNLFRIAAKWK